MDMFTETQKLVSESDESLLEISRATGLGHSWLRRYMNDDYKDVGVRKVEKLRHYLLFKKSTHRAA